MQESQILQTYKRGQIRYTSLLGKQVHKAKIDFEWPEKSDMVTLSQQSNFELTHLVMKGQPGSHLKGIGLGFSNGFMSPMCQPQVYGSFTTPAVAFPLDLEESYGKIYVKVMHSADETLITGIRIGNANSAALHYEWLKVGEWQKPLLLDPGE